MIYNFQLHRVTLVLIIALVGVGGGLLFFSGLLVGVSWQLEAKAPVATTVHPANVPSRDGPEVIRQNLTLPAQPAMPQVPQAPTAQVPSVQVPSVQVPSVQVPSAPAMATPTLSAPTMTAPAISVRVAGGLAAEEPGDLSPEAVTIPGGPAPLPAATQAAAQTALPLSASPRPAAPPTAADAKDPLRGLRKETPQVGFALQVGAFSQSENSRKLVEELAARGFEPYLVRTATRSNQQIESVRIGRFASRAEAAAAGEELARAEGISAFVVRASGVVR